jgi:hypothetical protein
MTASRFVRMAVLLAAVSTPASSSVAQDAPIPTAVTPRPAQIDQAVINMPTTLSLQTHGSYFRLTHRFARDLTLEGQSFGDLAADLFGLDNAAIIGLEYRFGVTSTVQAGVHRSTFAKAIEVFGRWDAWTQTERRPIGLALTVSFEGHNNLQQDFQPGASVTVSRTAGTRLAVYATPGYVHHAHTDTLLALHESHSTPGAPIDTRRDTFVLGVGGRLRILDTAFVVAEGWPRIAGYDPDEGAWNVGIEKLTHGHVLQLNFGNNFATTPGQIARGGVPSAVFIGFNISRKFS